MNAPRIFAHRGSHSLHPESSQEAYRAAINDGADGVECDIRLTSDHHIVIWHDATMERIAGNPARISNSTLDELKSIWPIMTLEELLEIAIANKKDLAIETKHPVRYGRRIERELAKLLKSKRNQILESGIEIFLMSFSWWATSYNSQAPYTGVYLVGSRSHIPFSQFAKAGLNIEILRNGFRPKDPSRILVWTVNDPVDIQLCKDLNVQVIITDNVPLAKSV